MERLVVHAKAHRDRTTVLGACTWKASNDMGGGTTDNGDR